MCMSVSGSHKRSSNSLELELQTVTSCLMWVLETELRSLQELITAEPSLHGIIEILFNLLGISLLLRGTE